MSTAQTFLLPDVGEGLTEADVVAWHVAVGDAVTVNQIVVDIETAKSVVELPSPYGGVVVELHAAVGETVAVGSPLISIGSAAAGPDSQGPSATSTGDAAEMSTSSRQDRSSLSDGSESEPKLLVGYGARDSETPYRRRGARSAPTDEQVHTTVSDTRSIPRAKPPVRKLANVLGVDLVDVTPTGPNGVIVRGDVINYAERTGANPARGPVPGRETELTRIPIKGVRKHTAAAVVASAFTAPHVTEFVTLDVTKTLELRDVVQKRREFKDVKLTPLAFVARAYLRALTQTPMAVARWDESAQEIVMANGVNLGIAAATPRGLIVPNIKGAHALGLRDLALAINGLATSARAGKTPPEDMAGGSTTITNVGVFGVDTGTPILNPGETAILAVGAIRRQPWVVEEAAGERIEPRSILELALSFDHRVLDGAEGSQVLADTAALLAEPGLAVLR